MGGKQNSEVKNQLDYIVNQVKIAVFNEPIIGSEEKVIAAGMGFLRKLTS